MKEKKKQKVICPVCGSEDTYWHKSGCFVCKDCNLIYEWITKKSINNPWLAKFAKNVLAYRKEYP